MIFQPKSVQDICLFVQENKHIYPRGGGTKRALSGGSVTLDMTAISGIIDYQPEEYVFTAHAGTPLKDIRNMLLEQGQFLPFDPLFIHDGATIGGTIAANSCGPGRYRYGSVRDFILRISVVDGEGCVFSGGEKVVKNAAGFDLPKFFVGSRGRFGIITEAGFKVFPLPPASLVITAEFGDLKAAIKVLQALARSSFDIHALDLLPSYSGDYQLIIRLSGLPQALQERRNRLTAFLKEKSPGRLGISFHASDDPATWHEQTTIAPATEQEWLFQVATTAEMLLELEQEAEIIHCKRRYCCAANLLFIYTPEPERLKQTLLKHSLTFQIPDGPGIIQQPVNESAQPMYQKLKQVFDPNNRFGDL